MRSSCLDSRRSGVGLRLLHLSVMVATRPAVGWLEFVIENPSSYVQFATSTMSEVEFLGELVRQTECGCCAMSATSISARITWDYSAHKYLDGLPAEAIGEDRHFR